MTYEAVLFFQSQWSFDTIYFNIVAFEIRAECPIRHPERDKGHGEISWGIYVCGSAEKRNNVIVVHSLPNTYLSPQSL